MHYGQPVPHEFPRRSKHFAGIASGVLIENDDFQKLIRANDLFVELLVLPSRRLDWLAGSLSE